MWRTAAEWFDHGAMIFNDTRKILAGRALPGANPNRSQRLSNTAQSGLPVGVWKNRFAPGCRARRKERRVAGHTSAEQRGHVPGASRGDRPFTCNPLYVFGSHLSNRSSSAPCGAYHFFLAASHRAPSALASSFSA